MQLFFSQNLINTHAPLQTMKIAIIGAGPAGTFTALNLARNGHAVDIYEEHEKVGEPLACTGILTKQLEKFMNPKKILVNTVHGARIIAGAHSVDVELGGGNLVIERVHLDQELAEDCITQGVRLHKRHRFESNTGKTLTLKDTKNNQTITSEADIIVGADGPSSAVAKANGIYTDRRWWIGVQVRADCPNDGLVEFYPTVGTYAWVVPENKEIARIGLCARTNVKPIFDTFLADRKVGKIHSYQGGLIPEYNPSVQTTKNNIRLVGDAATQVKATTGGGIVQSMVAGQALAESIHEHKSYDRSWKRALGKDLWVHLKLRTMMDRFSAADWEYLIDLFKQDKIRKVIEHHDRDYPSRFIASLFLREPRLFYFGRFLLG